MKKKQQKNKLTNNYGNVEVNWLRPASKVFKKSNILQYLMILNELLIMSNSVVVEKKKQKNKKNKNKKLYITKNIN